jgi:hypothetical protein
MLREFSTLAPLIRADARLQGVFQYYNAIFSAFLALDQGGRERAVGS